jgi:hypothetical protein
VHDRFRLILKGKDRAIHAIRNHPVCPGATLSVLSFRAEEKIKGMEEKIKNDGRKEPSQAKSYETAGSEAKWQSNPGEIDGKSEENNLHKERK